MQFTTLQKQTNFADTCVPIHRPHRAFTMRISSMSNIFDVVTVNGGKRATSIKSSLSTRAPAHPRCADTANAQVRGGDRRY